MWNIINETSHQPLDGLVFARKFHFIKYSSSLDTVYVMYEHVFKLARIFTYFFEHPQSGKTHSKIIQHCNPFY